MNSKGKKSMGYYDYEENEDRKKEETKQLLEEEFNEMSRDEKIDFFLDKLVKNYIHYSTYHNGN